MWVKSFAVFATLPCIYHMTKTFQAMEVTPCDWSYHGDWNTNMCIASHHVYDGGARGVMVIIVGNGHGDMSSNLGRDWLHFT